MEFKSDVREPFSDREIYENVVCLANTQGGVLFIGVENNGDVTGARARHGTATQPNRLQAAIFNNTVPPINTRISVTPVRGLSVIAIEVDPYPAVCATRDGKTLRRAAGVQGPECLPFYPHEHQSRRGDLGLMDYSAQTIESANWTDFDPLEIERMRQTIRSRRGEPALWTLDDRELVKALRLVETEGERLVPTVAGLFAHVRLPW